MELAPGAEVFWHYGKRLTLPLLKMLQAFRYEHILAVTPSRLRPLEAYAAPLAFIKDYEGEAMHHAGEALFAVVRDEPFVSASVQMDLGLFYRISEFAAGGTFIVGRKGAYAEAQASGDFNNASEEEAL